MIRLTSQAVIIHLFYYLCSQLIFQLSSFIFFMAFSKKDLTGLYNWTPEPETPLFEGLPSRRSFDRYNGNQVFFIITLLLERLGNPSIEQGREIEMMIINKLPFASSSELTVFNWLEKEMMAVGQ